MKKNIKAIKARKCSAYFFDDKTNKYFCFNYILEREVF